jgi:hypothetical protein
MKRLFGVVAASCLFPSFSNAADTGFGNLEPYGKFSIHRLSGNGFSENYWSGDFGIKVTPSETTNPVNYGLYVGYDGIGFFGNGSGDNGSDTLAYPTAAIVLSVGEHDFSIGVPRSVVSDIFDREDRVGNLLLDFEARLYTDTLRYVRVISSLDDVGGTFYGVRYDTRWSNTTLAAGLFWGEVFDLESRVVQIAASHEIGNLRFRAGYEFAQNAWSDSTASYSTGVTSVSGKFAYGIDATLLKYSDGETTTLDFFGTYHFNDRLKASISYMSSAEEFGDYSFSSIGLEFAPTSSSFVVVTVADDLFGDGNNPIYEASVGLRF